MKDLRLIAQKWWSTNNLNVVGRIGKRKNKIDIPESVCLFTPKEVSYITQAAKMIPWPVDIQLAQINVPVGAEEEAEEHLTVRHLVNMFGFAVQVTIHCEVKHVYDPKLGSAVKKPVEIPEEKPLLQRGSKLRNVRQNRDEYIFAETKTDWVMCVIGSMEPNYHMKKITMEIGIEHGIFEFRP